MTSDSIATREDRSARHAGPWRPEGRPVRLAILTWPVVVSLGATVAAAACLLHPCGKGERTQARETLVGHAGTVKSIAFRPDGGMLASVSIDGSIAIWGLTASHDDSILPDGPRQVRCAAFSPDNRLLATGNPTAPVALLDLVGHQIRRLEDRTGSSAGAASLVFGPDGTTLAVGGLDGHISLWDLAAGRNQSTLAGHTDFVASLAISPDGVTLASSSGDRSVRIWDLPSRRQRLVIKSPTSTYVALTFSPDGAFLAMSDQVSPVVRICDMVAGAERPPLRGPSGAVMTLAISPDGTTLAAADYRGQVTFWDLATFQIRPQRLRHAGVRAVAFAPDGRAVATGGFDGTIHLWDWPIPTAR